MKIKLHHGVNNETWRYSGRLAEVENEVDWQGAVDEFCEKTVKILEEDGHDLLAVYQQSRGIGMVCQTPEADDIVSNAMDRAHDTH